MNDPGTPESRADDLIRALGNGMARRHVSEPTDREMMRRLNARLGLLPAVAGDGSPLAQYRWLAAIMGVPQDWADGILATVMGDRAGGEPTVADIEAAAGPIGAYAASMDSDGMGTGGE